MKTQQIKNALNRSKLDFRANVSYVNLYTFIKFKLNLFGAQFGELHKCRVKAANME